MKRASVDVDETNCVGGGASAPSADGTIRREMKQLARLTWPIVLQMGSQQIMLACDLIYVGRLGRFENDSRVVVHRLVLVMLVLLGWIDVGNGHFSESSARRKRPESGEKLDDSCSFGGYRRVFPSRGIFVQLGSDSERRVKTPDAVAREVGRACVILFPGLWFMSWSLVYRSICRCKDG